MHPTIPNKNSTSPESTVLGNGAAWSRPDIGRPLFNLIALSLGVMLVVLITMYPVLSCSALSFDDNEYINENPLVRNPGLDSVGRFFAEVLEPSTVPGYYQPLAMTSLMLDVAAGGHPDDLRPFHRTGLLLHVLCTGLVILLAYQLFGHTWAAVAVGLLFGLHPAATEVIPWVAQRKTLLATFFSLLCLVSYVHYARRKGRSWYGVSMAMFVLAMLSKPTAVPIVAVLLILDWWPLGQFNLRKSEIQPVADAASDSRGSSLLRTQRHVLVEKLPFVVIAIVFAIITYISQSRTAGTVVALQHSWWHGPLILGYTLSFYPRQLVWPVGWPGYYSFPGDFSLSNPSVLTHVLASGVLLVVLVCTLRRTRGWMAGWLAYFILLFPTLGLIGFTDVLAANRFLYLPMIALSWPIASRMARRGSHAPPEVEASAESWPGGRGSGAGGRASGMIRHKGRGEGEHRRTGGRRLSNWITAAVVVLVAMAEGRASRSALVPWRDTLTLNRHLAASAPNAPKVRYNLGNALSEAGLSEDAMNEYRAAIELWPDYADAYNNLGDELVKQGHVAEGIPLLRRAIQLSPENAVIRNNYGAALLKLGRIVEALDSFQEAVRIKPNFVDAHFNIGSAMLDQGRWSDAAAAYEEVVRINPNDADAHARFGFVLEQLGRIDAAVDHYRKAVELDSSQHVASERLQKLHVLP